MNIFFGAPMQGHHQWGAHADIYETIIETIKSSGYTVLSEHAISRTKSDAIQKLEKSLGPLPEEEYERRVFVRNKMIEMLEREDLSAIIFEVSVPSLGTGVEIAHAYLRKRLGLKPVPILVLYKKDFWPNKLSTMIQGVPSGEFPNYHLQEYNDLDNLQVVIKSFILTSVSGESHV